jgi:hypothetical protein
VQYVLGRREMHTGFWWVELKKGYHLEDPGFTKVEIESGRVGKDWIDLAQDKDRHQV